MQRILLLLATFLSLAASHGRLTLPAPRSGNIEDPDQPINFKDDGLPESSRFPVNDPASHPEGQSFICRVPNSQKSALLPVTAGLSIDMKWEFTGEEPTRRVYNLTSASVQVSHATSLLPNPLLIRFCQTRRFNLTAQKPLCLLASLVAADHPGDGGLYISYDADYTDTQQMRFFKVANFPQQRRDNNKVISVKLPSWLPPGPAVLRWDWYATHNAPWTEFYANCVDIDISSISNVAPANIPSYKMEVGGSFPTSYSAYDCEDCWCFDCDADSWKAKGINGPPCVGGVDGNCCDLSLYDPVGYEASSGGGFDVCKGKGNSGAAPWLDNSGGGGGGCGTGGGAGGGGDADDGGLSLPVMLGGAFAAGVVLTLVVGAYDYAKCRKSGGAGKGGASKGPKKYGGLVKMRRQQLRGGQMV